MWLHITTRTGGISNWNMQICVPAGGGLLSSGLWQGLKLHPRRPSWGMTGMPNYTQNTQPHMHVTTLTSFWELPRGPLTSGTTMTTSLSDLSVQPMDNQSSSNRGIIMRPRDAPQTTQIDCLRSAYGISDCKIPQYHLSLI